MAMSTGNFSKAIQPVKPSAGRKPPTVLKNLRDALIVTEPKPKRIKK